MYRKKLKGFTLIEMIVVIAIITVLAGVMSLAIAGFQRDSRLETNQKKAQLVYTGFQNILIQCEITQEASWLNAANKIYAASTVPAGKTDKELKAVEVRFHVAQQSSGGIAYGRNDLGDIGVTSYYSSGNESTTYLRTGDTWYEDVRTSIMGNLDSSFEGSVAVYINYEDYVVDSVIYRELSAGGKDPTVNAGDFESYTTNKYYTFYGVDDYDGVRSRVNGGIYCGVYPYQSSL